VAAQLHILHGSRNVAKARAKPQEKQKQSKKDENGGERKLTEAQIAVHWKEEEYFQPSAKFIGQANLNDPAMVEKFSERYFPECFREYADLLHWDQYWHTTLDSSDPPFWKWFVGGKLNACYNCVDRHLEKYKNKAALVFVPEPEQESATVIT
jgi:acetyl-CoA synthetase